MNFSESLFELGFNMLARAKQFTQQNTSSRDKNISDTESNYSESESDDEERDEIIIQR